MVALLSVFIALNGGASSRVVLFVNIICINIWMSAASGTKSWPKQRVDITSMKYLQQFLKNRLISFPSINLQHMRVISMQFINIKL